MRFDRLTVEQEVDSVDQDSTSGHPAPTRRSLLTQAAGGFALAASGLFLPRGAEEATARKPVDGLRNRTGQRKRRRRSNGNNGNKKNNNKKNSKNSLSRRGIMFRVASDWDPAVKAEFYRFAGEAGVTLEYDLVTAQDIPPHNESFTVFSDPEVDCFLWINGRYYIDVWNPFFAPPHLKMAFGGSLKTDYILNERNAWQPDASGEIIVDDDVSKGDSKIMTVDNIKITVTYHDDSTDYKMFDVTLGF